MPGARGTDERALAAQKRLRSKLEAKTGLKQEQNPQGVKKQSDLQARLEEASEPQELVEFLNEKVDKEAAKKAQEAHSLFKAQVASAKLRERIDSALNAEKYEVIPQLIEELNKCGDAKAEATVLKNHHVIAEYNFAYGHYKLASIHEKSGAEAEVIKKEVVELFERSIEHNLAILQEGAGALFAYVPEIHTIESHFSIAALLMSQDSLREIPERSMTKAHKKARFHYKEIVKMRSKVESFSKTIEAMSERGEITAPDSYKANLIILWKHLGRSYGALGRDEEALDAFNEMTKVDPLSYDGFMLMSMSAEKSDDHAKSLEYAQKARVILEDIIIPGLSEEERKDINLKIYRINIKIGRSLRDAGKYEEAIKSFSEALPYHENNFEATYELAGTYLKAGKNGMAQGMLEALIINYPDNIFVINFLADIYYLSKDYEKASKLYNKLIGLPGLEAIDICRANTRTGMMLFAQNKVDEALKVLLTCNTVEALEYIAKIWFMKENYEEALSAYMKLKKLNIKSENLESNIKQTIKMIAAQKVQAEQSGVEPVAAVSKAKTDEVKAITSEYEELKDSMDCKKSDEQGVSVLAEASEAQNILFEPEAVEDKVIVAAPKLHEVKKHKVLKKLTPQQKKVAKEKAARKFKAANSDKSSYDKTEKEERDEEDCESSPSAASSSFEREGAQSDPSSDTIKQETLPGISGTPVMCSLSPEPEPEVQKDVRAVKSRLMRSTAAEFIPLSANEGSCSAEAVNIMQQIQQRDFAERLKYLIKLHISAMESPRLFSWFLSYVTDYDFDVCLPSQRLSDFEEVIKDLRVIRASYENDAPLEITGETYHH